MQVASNEVEGHQGEAAGQALKARLILAISARLGKDAAERIPVEALGDVGAAVIPGGTC